MRISIGTTVGAAVMALGLAVLAPVAASAEAPLQVSYALDKHLTCESIKDEQVRMDAIIKISAADKGLVKTATERRSIIDGLYKTKDCGSARKAEEAANAPRRVLPMY